MPALYMRLSAGRLWYTPGFTGVAGAAVRRRLVGPVRVGKVVPIVGPRLLASACGDSHDTARRLATDIHTLAHAYGWSEEQILQLSPFRRHLYLSAVRP